jgi:predicted anti-sigma-YlaC factor YlaD
MTGGDSCARVRLELGAYLVGAIEPAERALVNGHLRGCPACRAELSGMAGLPSLLRRVPVDTVGRLLLDDPLDAAPAPSLSTLLRRVAAIRRRRRVLAIAAAAITAAAAASGALALHASSPPAAAVAAGWAVTVQGTSPVTGVWAAVRYTGQAWGTELQASITGIAPGTRCQLVAIGTGGQKVAAGGWDLAASQPSAWYSASVPLRAASLRGFEIVAGRKILVTIPVRTR